MLIEFDAPEWIEKEGWEIVRLGIPNDGDRVANDDGPITVSGNTNSYRLIIRKKFQWPDWLQPGWITMDSYGSIEWWNEKPDRTGFAWNCRTSRSCNLTKSVKLKLPPNTSWKEAIWRVP